MILASFYLTSIIPIWNIFLISLFIACLIAISLSGIMTPSPCVHSHAHHSIWVPTSHAHRHHHNFHGREYNPIFPRNF